MSNLYAEWLHAKNEERLATERRRDIEDRMITQLGLPEVAEGTKSWKSDGFKVKITYRLNRKIDADLLQEVASENGYGHMLGELFRWKPEINKKEWDSTSTDITSVLEKAITTSMGRPSFSIEQE